MCFFGTKNWTKTGQKIHFKTKKAQRTKAKSFSSALLQAFPSFDGQHNIFIVSSNSMLGVIQILGKFSNKNL